MANLKRKPRSGRKSVIKPLGRFGTKLPLLGVLVGVLGIVGIWWLVASHAAVTKVSLSGKLVVEHSDDFVGQTSTTRTYVVDPAGKKRELDFGQKSPNVFMLQGATVKVTGSSVGNLLKVGGFQIIKPSRNQQAAQANASGATVTDRTAIIMYNYLDLNSEPATVGSYEVGLDNIRKFYTKCPLANATRWEYTDPAAVPMFTVGFI